MINLELPDWAPPRGQVWLWQHRNRAHLHAGCAPQARQRPVALAGTQVALCRACSRVARHEARRLGRVVVSGGVLELVTVTGWNLQAAPEVRDGRGQRCWVGLIALLAHAGVDPTSCDEPRSVLALVADPDVRRAVTVPGLQVHGRWTGSWARGQELAAAVGELAAGGMPTQQAVMAAASRAGSAAWRALIGRGE